MSKRLYISLIFSNLVVLKTLSSNHRMYNLYGAPDKPCGVGRADANPKLLLNDT